MDLKESSRLYEPLKILNIADLDEVPLELLIEDESGTDPDGKTFTYKYIELNGKKYRVPNTVREEIQKILKIKPEAKKIKVNKTGSGMGTKYAVELIE